MIINLFKNDEISCLDTYFEWDVQEPFSVSPMNGEIKAFNSIEIIFTFQPKVLLIKFINLNLV